VGHRLSAFIRGYHELRQTPGVPPHRGPDEILRTMGRGLRLARMYSALFGNWSCWKTRRPRTHEPHRCVKGIAAARERSGKRLGILSDVYYDAPPESGFSSESCARNGTPRCVAVCVQSKPAPLRELWKGVRVYPARCSRGDVPEASLSGRRSRPGAF